MCYKRQCRESPNKNYDEVQRDEVKYYFDILVDNYVGNISKITGFNKDFTSSTINKYLSNKFKI